MIILFSDSRDSGKKDLEKTIHDFFFSNETREVSSGKKSGFGVKERFFPAF